jgi:hypothetical protein
VITRNIDEMLTKKRGFNPRFFLFINPHFPSEKYRRQVVPGKHAHYAPAATFARVRLRNFC